MGVVEAFNYTVGIDATKMESGGRMTRRELSGIRREFRSMMEPAEKIEKRLGLLTRTINTGTIDGHQFAEMNSRIQATLPGVITETKRLSDLEADAARIRSGLMSKSELYTEEMNRIKSVVRDTDLTFTEGAEHLRQYKEGMTDAKQAAESLAAAQRDARSVTDGLMTDSQRYSQEQSRMNNLVKKGGLAQSQADRHMRSYQATLPGVIRKERQRSELLRRGRTAQNRYSTATQRLTRELRAEREELEMLKMVGSIDIQTYRRGKKSIARRERGGVGAAGIATAVRVGGTAMAAVSLAMVAKRSLELSNANKRAEASFYGLAGGAMEAKKVMRDIRGLRSRGLDNKAMQDAAAQFLAGDMSLKKIQPTLEMIGEVARGDTQRFRSLSLAFGQVGDQAKMNGGDLRQFINAGFNPLKVISDQTGTSIRELKKDMSNGLITFDQVEQAFIRATAAGGKFHGQLELVAQTTPGVFSGLGVESERSMESLGDMIGAFLHYPASGARTVLKELNDTSDQIREHGLVANGTIGRKLLDDALPKQWITWLFEAKDKAQELNEEMENLPDAMPGQVAGDMDRAKEDAAAKERMEKNAMSAGKIMANLRKEASVSQAKSLRDREKELQAVHATIEQLAEMQKLHEKVQENKRFKRVQSVFGGVESELKMQKRTLQIRRQLNSAGLAGDGSIARSLAEAEAAGANADEISRLVKVKRELARIKGRSDQMQEAVQRAEQESQRLKTRAKEIQESFQTPVQILAREFRDLGQMMNHGLLTAKEAAKRGREAATDAANASRPQDVSIVSVSAFSADSYKAIRDQQVAHQQEARDRSRRQTMIEGAKRILTLDTDRLVTHKAITDQMQQQADMMKAATPAPPTVAAPSPSQAVIASSAALVGNDEFARRITEASERTADAVEALDFEVV